MESNNNILEIGLNGKRYAINLEPLLPEVREELGLLSKATSPLSRDIESLSLLKAYITKAQEYAKLCQNLESLYQSLENATPQTHPIQIQSIESH